MNYRDTLMWKELNEAPAILQTLAKKNAKALAGIAAAAKEAAIAGVYTAARGTSDHAMIYFKYLCEAQCGLPSRRARRPSSPCTAAGLRSANF